MVSDALLKSKFLYAIIKSAINEKAIIKSASELGPKWLLHKRQLIQTTRNKKRFISLAMLLALFWCFHAVSSHYVRRPPCEAAKFRIRHGNCMLHCSSASILDLFSHVKMRAFLHFYEFLYRDLSESVGVNWLESVGGVWAGIAKRWMHGFSSF